MAQLVGVGIDIPAREEVMNEPMLLFYASECDQVHHESSNFLVLVFSALDNTFNEAHIYNRVKHTITILLMPHNMPVVL